MERQWHAVEYEEALRVVETTSSGLSSQDVEKRQQKYGRNVLPRERGYSRLRLFIRQFESPLIVILLAAAGISLYLDHLSDAIFIGVVLFINTTVAFYQEDKANRSLAALKKIVTITAQVRRDGHKREVESDELVPGDVVMLRAGDKVPADLRLIEARGLKINEAALTGEWSPVEKDIASLKAETSLGDRSNMAYLGTLIEEGEGLAVVIATGKSTEFGKIVSLLKETHEERTPLQKKILSLSRLISAFVLVVTGIVITLGFFSGQAFDDVLVAALALAVSAIPAGVLPGITVILVLGMRRILAEKGLVRKLVANETLGGVTVICTDKTGTLTRGEMQVSHILTGSRELLHDGKSPMATEANGVESHIVALKIATLTNDAFIENPEAELHEWVVRGRSTERAFLLAGAHAGLRKEELEKVHPVLERLSFNSVNKYAASLHQEPEGGKRLHIIGAPETIFSALSSLEVDGRKHALDSHEYTELIEKFESLTAKGLRVVATAYRTVPADDPRALSELIADLTLVGFIAIQDPLREDAKESVELTRRAGIRTIIITGDHRLTARSIAEEVGIEVAPDQILEGTDIERLSDTDLQDRMRSVVLCARVSPSHKLRLVEALRKNNEVVAMIGDGINDAPALKAADVGVAVGSGTEVAKETADIVLLDNNFRTIVKAVEQGRVIFQNIRRIFVYLVADDFSQLFIFFSAMAFGLPLPLFAAQILWINLVEDGFPDIALTTEQETAGVMDRPPRRPEEPILNGEIKWFMFWIFLITGSAAFLTYLTLLASGQDLAEVRTTIFVLMGFDSLLFAFVMRSFHRPIFRRSIFSNYFLDAAAILGTSLLFVAVYVPFFQNVLSTVPLDIWHWAVAIGVGVIEISLIELVKHLIFTPRTRLA